MYNIKLAAIPTPYVINIFSDKTEKIQFHEKSLIYKIPIMLINNDKKQVI